MLGLEYLLGFVKVFVSLGFSIVWAIPIRIIWKRLGPVYFDWVGERWLGLPYWHVVGLIFLVYFVGSMISALTPYIAKVNIEQKEEPKE